MQLSENSKKIKHLPLRHSLSKRGIIILAACLVFIGGALFVSRDYIGRTISSIYSQLTGKSESEEAAGKSGPTGGAQGEEDQATQENEYNEDLAEQSALEDPNIETEYTESITNITMPSTQERNTLKDADTE